MSKRGSAARPSTAQATKRRSAADENERQFILMWLIAVAIPGAVLLFGMNLLPLFFNDDLTRDILVRLMLVSFIISGGFVVYRVK